MDLPNRASLVIVGGGIVCCSLAGYHALNSLRMEKGYRHWGHDISDEDTPLQAGLGFAASFKRPGGFLGRKALLKQQAAGVARKLLPFALHDANALVHHTRLRRAATNAASRPRRCVRQSFAPHWWGCATPTPGYLRR